METKNQISPKNFYYIEHIGHVFMLLSHLSNMPLYKHGRLRLLSMLKLKNKKTLKSFLDLSEQEKESLIDILNEKKRFFEEKNSSAKLHQKEFFILGFYLSEYLLYAVLSNWEVCEKISHWYVAIKNSYLWLWDAEDEEGEIPSDVFAGFIEEAYKKHIDYARFSPEALEDLGWKADLDIFFALKKICWSVDEA